MREEIIGDARLILGDCREVIPTLSGIDAVVTDPPYGIGGWSANSSGGFMTKERAKETSLWDNLPSLEILQSIADLAPTVMWGGNYLPLGPWRSPLVWDKDQQKMHFAECEIAWTNFGFGTARILHHPIKSSECYGAKMHPTQKPIEVMQWSVLQTKALPNQTILDPFMGSGTTGVACAKLGRKFIGIEIDPGYFDIACRRIQKAYDQPDMFIASPEPEPKPIQGELIP